MLKKYVYTQGSVDKSKPLPPIYGKVPLRYRDRHHIINGEVYDCTGADTVSSIDPFSDGSLVAKWKLDGDFTNVVTGGAGLTLTPIDATRVYFEKSGPYGTKALNFYPYDTVSTNNNVVTSNYISNTVFPNGITISAYVKLNDIDQLYNTLNNSTVTEIFRITFNMTTDKTTNMGYRNPFVFFANSSNGTSLTNMSLNSSRYITYDSANNQSGGNLYTVDNNVRITNYVNRWVNVVYTSDNYSERIYLDGELVVERVSDKGKLQIPAGYLILGSTKYSNILTYKQVELYNRKITSDEVQVLLNQKVKTFTKYTDITYYEESGKLMYLNCDDDGNILSKGFEPKLGYNGHDKNLLSVDANGNIVDSYGNNPFAGKVNRILTNTSTTLATVTGAGWADFNTFALDMDTDNFDYVIILNNGIKIYGVTLNTLDVAAQVNININGNSVVTNAPLGYNNASNLIATANNVSHFSITTVSPKITSGFVGKFNIVASIAKYGLTANVNVTTWGVNNLTYQNNASFNQNRLDSNINRSDFIVYEIHKDNNTRI